MRVGRKKLNGRWVGRGYIFIHLSVYEQSKEGREQQKARNTSSMLVQRRLVTPCVVQYTLMTVYVIRILMALTSNGRVHTSSTCTCSVHVHRHVWYCTRGMLQQVN